LFIARFASIAIELRRLKCRMLSYKEARIAAIEDFEQTYLKDLLQLTNGNVSEAARVAELDRASVYRLIRRVLVARNR
jgi:transcriptional regulator of acetoin/glycerol metabolism